MSKDKKADNILKAIDLLIDKETETSNFWSSDGLLKQLTKRLVEKALEAEMDNHLCYKRYARVSINDNSGNGVSAKDVITDNGIITIDVPRDRESSFEPAIIPKRRNRIDGLDDKILSLYAKGMSLSDIKIQMQ